LYYPEKTFTNKIFGDNRAEIIVVFVNVTSWILVAIILIKEGVERFINPQKLESNLVVWLSLVAITGNGFSVLLLKKNANRNMNIKSVYMHLLKDTMVSIAVLIGGLLMLFFQWYWVDAILTFAIANYLIFTGMPY
jgi:cobalt-zinc-cadmium efflux system protein